MTFILKCCGRIDPIGIHRENIRLSFETDGSHGISAYTIYIKEALSGKSVCTLSGDSTQGFTAWVEPDCVQPATCYLWQVDAQLEDGQTATSQPARFETGIESWEGQWIGLPGQNGRVLGFQKEITLEKPPKKARLYICGLGYFSSRLNGTPLDDSLFIPPVTDYSTRRQLPNPPRGHRVTYYTYDVTGLLRPGSNILYTEVSEGYYTCQEKLEHEPQPDLSFGQPCLCYELHIEDGNGVRKFISDGSTWVRPTNTVSRLYSGDVTDFTEKPAEYVPAQNVAAPDGVMTSPMCEGDRVQQVLTPVTFWETPEGRVYDFGVNHSGGLRFTAEAEEEVELVIRYAEVLHSDGTLNYETSAWHGKHVQTGEKKHIYQQNTYRLKKGSNAIEPKFSWFCYRYVLIPNDPALHISGLSSLFIHMDIERDGSFECSEELLNRINATFLQTLFCNMHSGLIMDCPHRERLPYTGDGKLVMKSACYNLSAADHYYKWFRDILDAQSADGLIPNSAPYFGGGGGYAWGNALCTVSRQLYCLTGDMTVARQGYAAIIKWLSYYESKRDRDYIIRSNSHAWMLGDWLAPDTVTSDVYYISTVCYLQAVKTALFFARLIDPERTGQWEQLQKSITGGINRVFFDEEKCTYGNGVQGENMLALAEDIVPEKYRQRMHGQLKRHYSEETDYHLDTGVVLTPVLLDYLTDHGLQDMAWRIMTAQTYPSYAALMEGDTTFCEHWSKQWPDYYFGEPGNSRLVKGGGELSHCHPMYGSVAAWLYERVAGLDLSELYRKTVLVKPFFMDCLPWAKANKKTAWGEARVEWCRKENVYTLRLSVPKGLTAACHFPAGCGCLKNSVTGQLYYPNEDGYFDFTLNAGQWLLINLDMEG